MKILSVNVGSSSLKGSLIELPEQKVLATSYFEKIGMAGSFYTIKINGEKIRKEVNLVDHSVAVSKLLEELIENNIISSIDEIDGVGHRIAFGGTTFDKSVILDEQTLEELAKYNDLVPLHGPVHIMGVRAFMKMLPNVKNVGVFDTAFLSTMDEEKYIMPVPYEWYEKFGIRRFGYHGTSHRFIAKTVQEFFKRDDLKIISCHIGSGASICAIDSGKAIDTSMGMGANSGLMMGTRSGDVDNSIIPYVMKKTGKTLDEVYNDLNKKSGLLGISGVSSDSRDVEEASANGNHRAKLAEEIYAREISNYIAMFNNELNGADVIVLTAGIGENSSHMRKMILDRISSLGVKLDESKNDFRGEFRLISTEDSKIPVYVIPTDEELMIALDTMDLIS